MKKSRLGSDPLDWIGKKDDAEDRKPTKRDKLSKQSKPKKQGKQKLPKNNESITAKTSREGLPPGWTRATFIMREDHLEKLKALAYWDRKQIKEIVGEAIEFYLKDKKVKPTKKTN